MASVTGIILAVTAIAGAGVSYASSVSAAKTNSEIAHINAITERMAAQQRGEAGQLQARINAQLAANEEAQARENAAGFQKQAEAGSAASRQSIQRTREEAARFAAMQRAAIGKGGVVDTTGSPLRLLEETARQAQYEAETMTFNDEEQRRSLFREADGAMQGARNLGIQQLGYRAGGIAAAQTAVNQQAQAKLDLYSARAASAGMRSQALGSAISSVSSSAAGGWTSFRGSARG